MNEKIIVYEHASKSSLDKYMGDVSLTWMKRLKICIDVASGLDFLHSGDGDLKAEILCLEFSTTYQFLPSVLKACKVVLQLKKALEFPTWEPKLPRDDKAIIHMSLTSATLVTRRTSSARNPDGRSNDPKERHTLWADLGLHKLVVRGLPWVLLRDFNVALNMEDVCTGTSIMNLAMCDFKDCVTNIEVVDINSTSLQYTWNQKPYRISDHSPAVLKIPSLTVLKPNPFKFFNFLAYKGKFHEMVDTHWKTSVVGHSMFQVQKALDRDSYNNTLREEEAMYVQAFNDANIDEEHFLKQKTKIEWLEVGLFDKKVSAISNNIMTRQVTKDEIKKAMFDIGDDKSPGPDGYTSLFFEKGWDIVRDDVCNAILDFFSNGKLLHELNPTFFALIPKVTTPSRVNDYRPISCCNVIYKCISKIITNRIIEGFKEVVSDNQSAFVPGRRISDNILITQELMHNYHRNKGPSRCAFKVDIQKAYDTVDWRFLGFILKCFDFHPTIIKWIMAYVTSASYSISINRNIHGYFKGKQGLRQGDPLSPYLFTLIMESLTLILQRKVRLSNSFRYHKHCEEMQLINVCFADDLFIFAHGDVNSANVIMDSLDEFKRVSTLVPSNPKSTVFFCNVLNHVNLAILYIMPFAKDTLSVKNLGFSLITYRLLNRDCKVLVEKATNRIRDWKNKSLSFAGWLQLCKSVISSMQVYWALVLVIPLVIVEDIQQLIPGFLWCNGDLKRGKAKVA
nr:hypothetical protein [Tanacetum cinerariifolium]